MDFDKFYSPISSSNEWILIMGKDKCIYEVGLLSKSIVKTECRLDGIDIQSIKYIHDYLVISSYNGIVYLYSLNQ